MSATADAAAPHHEPSAKDIRLVIAASSAGTVFEWYDFFIYGTLAALIGKAFFPADNETLAAAAGVGRLRGRLRLPPAGRDPVRLSSATGWAANTPSSSPSR